MIIKNKTNRWQRCGDVAVRPWRDVTVADDSVIDENVFEIITKSQKTKQTKNIGE